MTPYLLSILCDPVDRSPLSMKHPRYDEKGNVQACILESENGNTYPVRAGIPRFTGERERVRTAVSDAEQHSSAHQKLYKHAWLSEFVQNTFGSPQFFAGKMVVDLGGGSGYQAKWMLEHGAKHVIYIENSQNVDGIVRECMEESEHIDIVQCSLDALPFKPETFDGVITCNDALRHTESFDTSLKKLWGLLKEEGEIVFHCPVRQTKRWYHKWRYKWINIKFRDFLSKRSEVVVSSYARLMALLHLIPGVQQLLIKNQLVHRTTRPRGYFCLQRRYKDALHHTFEYFAGHKHEHCKTEEEVRSLVTHLQKDPAYIMNMELFLDKNRPNGLSIRLKKI